MDVSAGRFLAARLNRVLELTSRGGIHTCGDGYTRHVERTGQRRRGCGAEAQSRGRLKASRSPA
ncbi:MAG: hypothetical protein E5V25_15445 [Mesorhizobium sp.]|nr:MAG: hypothetical protein EOQ43_20670 [Mesorhizobium sp.]TGU01021.1 hypothetical protein EN807_15035 [Mesorhizobium sp. M5C.F.Ca.ET.164.01.1.1]RWB34546.1 MAG: hypothetical protein EOQ41_09310 [Mesorhizobium sp.]RWB57428.1 MAG: hypothetical protein EOQ42_21725 [Mesorhizobium sp.]RWC19857.1 MAG: hypothetical protein EOS51_14465 [Mesorhizobium sp.]